jgi:hypothetical protein
MVTLVGTSDGCADLLGACVGRAAGAATIVGMWDGAPLKTTLGAADGSIGKTMDEALLVVVAAAVIGAVIVVVVVVVAIVVLVFVLLLLLLLKLVLGAITERSKW